MDQEGNNHIKGVVETLLFTSEKPVTLEQIKEVLEGIDVQDIRTIIDELQRAYDERKSGMSIVEIAGGYQMLTNPLYAGYVKKFYHSTHKEKLSKPALETLAIIAYKQPVSRLDIELIRGVNSDGVTTHLFSKGLIKIVGRKDVPGRPYLYGTTKEFLEYFGLKSLEDLPKLEDFSSLQEPGGEEVSEEIQQAIKEEPQAESQESPKEESTEEVKDESSQSA